MGEWWQVLTLFLSAGVSAGVFTAIVNNLLAEWRDRRKEKRTSARDAVYLAMQVAVIIERFAIECEDIINHNELHTEFQGHAGTVHWKLPPLGEYPTDADWKALDPSLSSRALSLPNELRVSEGVIKFWSELEPRGQGILLNTCNGQAGKCGYRAWQLAVDIRRRYGLSPVFEPDFVKVLKENYEQELKRMKDSAAARERHELAAAAGKASII
jgi:hypothetical protein